MGMFRSYAKLKIAKRIWRAIRSAMSGRGRTRTRR